MDHMNKMEAPAVPVVDFADFSRLDADDDGEGLRKLAKEMGDAFQQFGAFYLDNTEFPESAITELWESGDLFFDQPVEAKERYLMSSSPDKGGYVGYGQDKGYLPDDNSDEIIPEGHESMIIFPMMSNFVNPPDEEAAGLMPRFMRFFDEAAALCLRVLRCVALDLGKDKLFFEKNVSEKLITRTPDGNSSAGRLNFYPPCTGNPERGERFAAHKDFGGMTLLWIDNVTDGLQGEIGGVWRDILPRPRSLLVLAATTLEIFSAGRYQALHHRVVPGGQHKECRRSTVFFYSPDEHCLVAPLDGNSAKAKTYKEHLRESFAEFMQDKPEA